MTTEQKRVLIISKAQGLSNEDRKALEDAGYIVVRVKYPNDVRMLTGEPLPFTTNDMLRAAVNAIASSTSDALRARAWNALCKLAFPQDQAGQQQ